MIANIRSIDEDAWTSTEWSWEVAKINDIEGNVVPKPETDCND